MEDYQGPAQATIPTIGDGEVAINTETTPEPESERNWEVNVMISLESGKLIEREFESKGANIDEVFDNAEELDTLTDDVDNNEVNYFRIIAKVKVA